MAGKETADAVVDMLGRVLRASREGAERVARMGRERLMLRRLRSDRDRLYRKLGKEVRELLDAGELEHPGLRRGVSRIAEIDARVAEVEELLRRSGETVEPDPSESGESGAS